MNKSIGFGIILVLVTIVTLSSSFFVVSETQQAIVTQFGKIQGEAKKEAGPYFKIPFLQEVSLFEKRILSWDGDPEQIPTKDKKYIIVDTTARWRIKNPIVFAQTLFNERAARDKLDAVLDGITRDTISNNNLVEAVRNTNKILDDRKIKAEAKAVAKAEDKDIIAEVEEEFTGDIEPVNTGREALSQVIAKRATEELQRFGIELIDVQLRRIAYEQSVEQKVYQRMISERNRIAEKIRSIGKGEEAKIKGKLNEDLKAIESEAYKTSQGIKGTAEASAIEIYAKSLGKDPAYYSFVRTLESYRKTLPRRGDFILTTDSEYLKLLNKSK